MRVSFDITAAMHHAAGIGRYSYELAAALQATCPPDEQLELFYIDRASRSPAPPLDALPRRVLNRSGKAWRFQVMLAHYARLSQDKLVGQPNIFIATDHVLPYLTQASTVFVLYDLSTKRLPGVHLRLNRWYLNLMLPYFLQRATAITTISDHSRRDIQHYYNLSSKQVHVIPPAVHARFAPVDDPAHLEAVRQRYSLPSRFSLYVGTIEPRKNIATLLQAFQAAHLDDGTLVIAGKKGWLFQETFELAQSLGLADRVIFTGFVADDDLPALYSLATAFAFPSWYEGFGIPVLEAMACGTPVMCSNTSSLPEVAGDAALLLAPDDVPGWAHALTQVWTNASLRADLSRRGLKQAARFTWTAAAAQLRQVYRTA